LRIERFARPHRPNLLTLGYCQKINLTQSSAMKTYKCIIVDDEPYAVEWLTAYIAQLPNLMLIRSYLNPLEALADLTGSLEADLLLIDIKMPFITGFDLSQRIRSKSAKLVFTTGYKQFAYQAFEADADAYLLKPYTLSKFAATITKLFPTEQEPPVFPRQDDFFFVKNVNDSLKLVKVKILDLVAVESKQNYIMMHTANGNITTRMSLTEMSNILKRFSVFEQFQRSFIIGKLHIEHIYGNTIHMSNGLQITVGDLYRKDFATFLSEKLLKSRSQG
jgi:DNA-binding LytR/AlgR family response regulator